MTDRRVAQPPLGLVAASLLRADGIVLLRSRTATLLGLILPVVLLVATGSGSRAQRFGGAALSIGLALTIGLLTSCLLGYALTLAHDRELGVLRRLRVTPAPAWTIMGSRIAVQVASNVVGSLIVVVVGVVMHGLTLTFGQYLVLLMIAAIGAAMILSIGQALVGLVTSTAAVNAFGRLLFIVLLLLGLLGNYGVLGDTVKAIAGWTPVGALMALFSSVVGGAGWVAQDTYSLLACAGYIAVFAVIGIRWFRWETH